jgi:hypothetical protein
LDFKVSRALSVLVLVAIFMLAAACSSLPEERRPQEYLDERTGATVTMTDKPIVFARDRTERAANLRDYVTLVAASVNRAGKINYVLLAYAWSTLDSRDAAANGAGEALVITADDRRIALKPAAASAVEAGISVPVRAPPGVASISRVYASDLDTLRFIGAARSLRAQVSSDESAPYYYLWDDQRTALGDFVRFSEGDVRTGSR